MTDKLCFQGDGSIAIMASIIAYLICVLIVCTLVYIYKDLATIVLEIKNRMKKSQIETKDKKIKEMEKYIEELENNSQKLETMSLV